jgi:putative DNA primase/helicase
LGSHNILDAKHKRAEAKAQEQALREISAADYMGAVFPDRQPHHIKIDLRSNKWKIRPTTRRKGRPPKPNEGRRALWCAVHGEEEGDRQIREFLAQRKAPALIANETPTSPHLEAAAGEQRQKPVLKPKLTILEDEAVKSAFESAMLARGLTIPKGGVIADGKLQRCNAGDDKSGKADGAYILHLDGFPAGGFQNHRDGLGWQDWKHETPGRTYTEAEKKAHAERIAEIQRQRDADEAERHALAAKRASAIIEKATPADNGHRYLNTKGVGAAHGLKEHKGALVVPMRDIEGKLHSLQFIAPDGKKRFLKGGKKHGCLNVIGKEGLAFDTNGINPTGRILICEGFATAARCFEAVDHPAVIAFDAGNLKPVAEALRGKYPKAAITFCADDDFGTEGNPGKTKAIEAAKAIGATVALPAFPGIRRENWTDFNDLHCAGGLEAVAKQIGEAAAPADEIKDTAGEAVKSGSVDIDAAIDRLARMTGPDYERERAEEAKKLGIKRVTALDSFVKARRAEFKSERTVDRPSAPEVWDEPVDGDQLLIELIAAIKAHVILSDEAATAIAIWIVLAHAHDAAAISAILAIISPLKGCGKTTLLSLLQELTPNPIIAANISAAAVYRAIEE